MNQYDTMPAWLIVTIYTVLFKPKRKYFGIILFGGLMRTGMLFSRLLGHTEGLVKRMYEQLILDIKTNLYKTLMGWCLLNRAANSLRTDMK